MQRKEIQECHWSLRENSQARSDSSLLRCSSLDRRGDLDRPGQAFLGLAEALRGLAGAAIANALADAIGALSHDTPLTHGRVLAAINPVVCDP
ncbi:MAG: hypothetical protein EOO27_03180 [Comamonadaceae bacterium]|nr:MAG: hypothetical protein EOO27_03180 [Comamonadaceae bacterium]